MKRSHRLLAATSGLLLLVAACADDDPGDGPDTTAADATDDAAADDDAVEQEDAADDTTEDTADDTTEDASEGENVAAEGDATVAVGSTDIGDVLVDADGMTLYLFDVDEQGPSACYDDCASNWPPLTTDGDPVAGDGVDGSLLGTSERDDGTMQVTYDGWPLYGFIGDQSPGDVAGQAVQDVWWVLDASGEPLREGAAAQEEDDEARSSY